MAKINFSNSEIQLAIELPDSPNTWIARLSFAIKPISLD